jgi:predicted transcriptional regulator
MTENRTAHEETEEWQLREIRSAIAELDAGRGVSQDKVSKWLNSWGKPGETKAPR